MENLVQIILDYVFWEHTLTPTDELDKPCGVEKEGHCYGLTNGSVQLTIMYERGHFSSAIIDITNSTCKACNFLSADTYAFAFSSLSECDFASRDFHKWYGQWYEDNRNNISEDLYHINELHSCIESIVLHVEDIELGKKEINQCLVLILQY
jgi:hypothetical protein